MNQTKQTTAVKAPLAMVQIPPQEWEDVYDSKQALLAGTLFPSLDKPFFMGGE